MSRVSWSARRAPVRLHVEHQFGDRPRRFHRLSGFFCILADLGPVRVRQAPLAHSRYSAWRAETSTVLQQLLFGRWSLRLTRCTTVGCCSARAHFRSPLMPGLLQNGVGTGAEIPQSPRALRLFSQCFRTRSSPSIASRLLVSRFLISRFLIPRSSASAAQPGVGVQHMLQNGYPSRRPR